MLQGKYVHHCSAWSNSAMLHSEETTLPRYLSKAGYTTACVGKMHISGPHWMAGFDHRPYGDLRVTRYCFHQPDPPETANGDWTTHTAGYLPYAGETRIPESLLADSVATREALGFLLELNDRDSRQPWFMCVGYSRPHHPLTTPGRYVRRALAGTPPIPDLPDGYPSALHPHDRFIVEDFNLTRFSREQQWKGLACYYACIDYLDDCIGELLDGLERNGLLENTYVIYASDHGNMAAEHGLWWKRTYYDACASVPLIIAGPDLMRDALVDRPVELVDLFPTICDIADCRRPDNLDGESLLPLCRKDGRNEYKKITARSELISPKPETAFRMIRDKRWKYVEFAIGPPALFDLEKDPAESLNLLASGARTDAPVDALRRALRDGLDWGDLQAMRNEDLKRWAGIRWEGAWSPVQYQLSDGRIENADAFLYPDFPYGDQWFQAPEDHVAPPPK
jgi:choline-sulfatase